MTQKLVIVAFQTDATLAKGDEVPLEGTLHGR